MNFPWWLRHKESACNAGDPGSIPGLGRSPEEGMATHFSILAWRISWTEEPGRLESTGLHRLGHDRCNLTQHGVKYWPSNSHVYRLYDDVKVICI